MPSRRILSTCLLVGCLLDVQVCLWNSLYEQYKIIRNRYEKMMSIEMAKYSTNTYAKYGSISVMLAYM